LLNRRSGAERRHDGRIAVDERNRRWCSDGFEISCDNGAKVRVAFALDCCDREAMSFLATTGGIRGEDVRDLMVAAVEYRFGRSIACRLPSNGSPTTAAATSLAIPAASLARSVWNPGRRLSKVHRAMEWPKLLCDQTRYVRRSPRPNAETVMHQLPSWITHYNEVHPHKALGYRSPREFIAARENP
jgi:putative transposase